MINEEVQYSTPGIMPLRSSQCCGYHQDSLKSSDIKDGSVRDF